jgi:hypothetical protein
MLSGIEEYYVRSFIIVSFALGSNGRYPYCFYGVPKSSLLTEPLSDPYSILLWFDDVL